MHFGLISAVLFVQHIMALDNLELLGETLRSFQSVSCDGQTIMMKCPPGTCISVQMAQYLTSPPPACKSSMVHVNSTCLWASTIQTVVEACQKKSQCELPASPNIFITNLCPHRRMFVQVYYKCRPYEFRSKMACQDDVLHMSCDQNSRVAVYSASFGRVEYENVLCHQPQGVREETCLVRYATETVMQLCHGKRECNLSANSDLFGNPCQSQSRLYLKVVYTCVPRNVLKDYYLSNLLEDEILTSNHDTEVMENADDGYREIPSSESPNLAIAGHNHSINTNTPSTATDSWLGTVSSKSVPITGSPEDISVSTKISCLGFLLILGLVTLVLVRMACRRYCCVPTPPGLSGSKGVTEGAVEDMGVDLTAVTPSSAVTVWSSP